ncbi:MAG: 50S ribosomal protein L29 [Candidatus Buchananbacteria bacterium]|nr:50S ribosomal protein L29 [Candidatus Buchananbacteria bacterium]
MDFNFKELEKKSVSEWQKILADAKEKLRDLKFKAAANQLKDISEIKKVKKTIARLMLLINTKTEPKVKKSDSSLIK